MWVQRNTFDRSYNADVLLYDDDDAVSRGRGANKPRGFPWNPSGLRFDANLGRFTQPVTRPCSGPPCSDLVSGGLCRTRYLTRRWCGARVACGAGKGSFEAGEQVDDVG